MIRIFENENWVIDQLNNETYRISYFENYHFIDELIIDLNTCRP